MHINALAGRYGIFEPDDLAFLRRIFADIVATKRLTPADERVVADRLLYLFSSGVRDREMLYQAAIRAKKRSTIM